MSGRSVLPTTMTGWLKAAAIVLLIVWSLGPIVWIVMTSLKTRLDIIAAPPTFFFVPNLDAYVRAFGANGIVTQLQNSIVIALATTVLSLTLSVIAAYAFSRYRFAGRTVLMVGLLAARLFPPVAAVVPLYMTASDLRLVDTLWILIIIYTALNIPFAVWLLKTYIDTVPREIEESAVVEGAGLLRTIFRITLPLIAPGVMATAVFVFVLAWNEFMFAYMFTTIDARTVPVVLAEARGDEIIFWQDLAAQATLLILPTIALGFLMQRYLVRGLSAGAVK
jgi:ABC-type glycerol-3-phosphate transport system permease component